MKNTLKAMKIVLTYICYCFPVAFPLHLFSVEKDINGMSCPVSFSSSYFSSFSLIFSFSAKPPPAPPPSAPVPPAHAPAPPPSNKYDQIKN